MKQFLTATIIALLILPLAVVAQDVTPPKNNRRAGPPEAIIQPSLILGFNTTQIDGDGLSGFHKFGAAAGAGAYIRLPKNLMLNFEILYSQKGSRSSKTEAAQLGGDYKLILDYIDIPISLNYNDKDIVIGGLGVVVNNRIRYEETYGGVAYDTGYKRLGAEFLATLTFLIKRKYGINVRYTYSLNKINNADTPVPGGRGNQRITVLSLRFLYIFR